MKTMNVPMVRIGLFVFLCLTLVVGSRGRPVVGAEPKMRGKGLLESKDQIVAAYKKSIARVVSILADKRIRESDRRTTVAAIQLAGALRAKEAVPHLVDLLLYGKEANIEDVERTRRDPAPPDSAAPAVQALINIGMPSLEAVCQKLVSTAKPTKNKNTLRLHCVWVIWKVLGTDLGKEYLLLCQKRHPKAKEVFNDVMGFSGFARERKGPQRNANE